jgi:Ni/Co efflux regulator RcnB
VKGRFLTVALIASFLAANVAVAATNPPAQHHSKKGTHPGHHGAKKHPQQHSGAHKKGSKPHTGQ